MMMQYNPLIICCIDKMCIELVFLDLLIRFLQHIRFNLIDIKEIDELIEINRTAELVQLLVKFIVIELLREVLQI